MSAKTTFWVGAALASMIAGGVVVRHLFPAGGASVSTFRPAAEAFERGDDSAARKLARRSLEDESLPPEESGGPYFILGALAAQEAEATSDATHRRQLYLSAASLLEQARQHGFPPGYESQGPRLLAASLFHGGRHRRAVTAMAEAIETNPDHAGALHLLAAEACNLDGEPQLNRALRHVQDALKIDGLSPDQRAAAQFLRARLLIRKGLAGSANELLDQLEAPLAGSPQTTLLRGMAAVTSGEVERGRDLIRQAKAVAQSADPVSKMSDYWLAEAYLKLNDLTAAESQFLRTARLYADEAEAAAALLGRAEALRGLRRDEDALGAYRLAVQAVGDPRIYSSPWVSLKEFRERLYSAYQDYLDRGEHLQAVELAKALVPVYPTWRSFQMRGEAHRDAALTLAQQAEQTNDGALMGDARNQHRKAAIAFAEAARRNRASRNYADLLWQAAQGYLAGHDFERASALFSVYLDTQSTRRAEAMTALAESLLAQGDFEGAMRRAQQVVERHSKHPASYQARFLASRAAMEIDNVATAQGLLAENLYDTALTPRSAEWRNSLLALGRLHFREAVRLEALSRNKGVDSQDQPTAEAALAEMDQSEESGRKAIRLFQEWIARYGDEGEAHHVKYLLAQTLALAAKGPRRRLRWSDIDATRRVLQARMRQDLEAALNLYDELLAELNATLDQANPSHRRMLRNCYFGRADTFFDLERYDDALSAYATAGNLYQRQPESIEAWVQVASCHRRLGRQTEARGALEQAKAALSQIPADADFKATTRFSRAEWQSLLDLLAAQSS